MMEFLQLFRGHRFQRYCRQRKFADRLQLWQFLQRGLKTDAPASPRKCEKPISRSGADLRLRRLDTFRFDCTTDSAQVTSTGQGPSQGLAA
jgi:hypothetical protein